MRPLRRLASNLLGSFTGLVLLTTLLVPTSDVMATQKEVPAITPTVEAELAAVGKVRPAANLALFNPGNIISDAAFFNSGTMTESQIDSFFRSKVLACQTAPGFVCLKDYQGLTTSRPADAYCDGYQGGGSESAARIVFKTARSCGINPQVLIVMLQKEQGLVTHTRPDAGRYGAAMGQACPDTAACDPRFAGFFNQVYGAARQMQIYAEGRHFTWYAPGKTWNILYSEKHSCGSSPVYIENIATSALYYYTPYQPNRASLDAGYAASSDRCASYGNRNFFQYFWDWFGNPQGIAVEGSIAATWNANGGLGGWIGAPVTPMRSWPNASGWSQRFANADIFVQAGRQGQVINGPIRAEYRLVGEAASGLGWPTTPQYAESGGAYQEFESGRIYQRPDGPAYAIGVPMYTNYVTHKGTGGSLGWPTGRAYPVPGGSAQGFDSGRMYQTGNTEGVITLSETWEAKYRALGGPSGVLGFPVGDPEPRAQRGFRLLFTAGALYLEGSTWRQVTSPFFAEYSSQGLDDSHLGVPTGDIVRDGAWSHQSFFGGSLFSSGSQVFTVTDFIQGWSDLGGSAQVGYPVGQQINGGDAASQQFTKMTLTLGTTGVQHVRGIIKNHYDAVGGAKSVLGAAVGPERPLSNGAVQDFEGGRIVCTPSATVTVPKSIADTWDRLGGATGSLGIPTGPPATIGGNTQQSFTSGYVMSAADGTSHSVRGVALRTFLTEGGLQALGAPLQSEQLLSDAVVQEFQRGTVFVPFTGRATAVSGAMYEEFMRVGSRLALGYPSGPASTSAAGAVQRFQLGSISTSPAGTFSVRGAMRIAYDNSGAHSGPLGFPIGNEVASGNGVVQHFQRGTAYVSPFSLTVTRGALHREYTNRGGPNGSLGWPVSNEVSANGGALQKFQNGTIHLYADGAVAVR